MKYWAFTVGTRDTAPPREWLVEWDHHVYESWFAKTKRPVAVSAGDRAVVYGSQGRGFIAAVEVVSNQPEPNDHERYPWKLRHRLLVSKLADDNIASPENAGINPNKIARGPHTEIGADEYQRAVQELLKAAAKTAA